MQLFPVLHGVLLPTPSKHSSTPSMHSPTDKSSTISTLLSTPSKNNLSESLHTPTKQSAELKFIDSDVTDDELLTFESSCGSNICLGEEANDHISLGQAFELATDESKENDSKDKSKYGESNIS